MPATQDSARQAPPGPAHASHGSQSGDGAARPEKPVVPLGTAQICKAVGIQVMDCLNGAGHPVATMGHGLPDGSYEFLLGPVYLPHDQVSLRAPAETRQLLANLRLED